MTEKASQIASENLLGIVWRIHGRQNGPYSYELLLFIRNIFLPKACAETKTKFPAAVWFAKLGLWLLCCFVAAQSMAQFPDNPTIETEAQRLDAVRNLVRQEKSPRPGGNFYATPGNHGPSCEKLLTDLLGNEGFKAIEPAVVMNHEYPILSPDRGPVQRPQWLIKKLEDVVEKKLGKTLVEGLNRCAEAEANGDERRARNLFMAFNYLAGDPPYRVYVLPKKLNPFPNNQLMYLSQFIDKNNANPEHYVWVNLDICEHKNAIGYSVAQSSLKRNTQDLKTAITFYQGKLVVWNIDKNFAFSADLIDPKNKKPMKSRVICNWLTYPESLK